MPNPITIKSPVQGIGRSAYTGFGNIQNLDFDTIPGVVRLNKKLSLATGTFTELPNWIVRNPNNSSEFFALGAGGQVQTATDGSGATWTILGGNSTTAASGNGLAIWNDYLFVARDANLDTFGPLSSRTITAITNATPGIVQFTAHGFSTQDGTAIIFSTSGALPTGLVAGTVYYVGTVHGVDEFSVSATQGGADINTSSAGSGTHKFRFWRSSTVPLTFKAIDSDVDWHPMWVSKNNSKLYLGAGKYVASLEQLTTFDPTVASSFTWTSRVLTLPSGYRIKCLAEIGEKLAIGTWQGTDVRDFAVADIFLWDRDTTRSFDRPVQLSDFGVHAMLPWGNTLIVLAGVNGYIYQTDGVNFSEIAKLPMDLGSEWIIFSPGAICKYKDKVFFGVGGGSGAANTINPMGTYSLKLSSQGNILNLEHTNSQDTTGSAESVVVSALLPVTGQRILVGFISGSTKGIDLTSSGGYNYGTDYIGRFDTPFYPVGSAKAKALFTELDFFLSKNLATGEGIQISYRLKDSDSFTVIGTFTHDIASTTILGAVNSHFAKAGVPKDEQVQFRIGLKGTTTTTPSLKQVEFK